MSNRDGNTNHIINYHKCTCFKYIQKCIVLYKNTKYILYYIITPKMWIIGACLLTFYNITLTNPIVVVIHV